MPEPERLLRLGIYDAPPSAPPQTLMTVASVPDVSTLQFRRADAVPDISENTGSRCRSCTQSIADSYFHVQGQIVCPACTAGIQANQKAPPVHSLLKAALYGFGAAFAGAALYAIVTIVTRMQLALIAILIGYMVGTAVRKASNGLGGRPQQILAVALTSFAITTSFIPVVIYRFIDTPKHATVRTTAAAGTNASQSIARPSQKPHQPLVAVVASIFLFALVAPFWALSKGLGALVSLVIIFFGLQRAWEIAGRKDLVIMGPYQSEAPSGA